MKPYLDEYMEIVSSKQYLASNNPECSLPPFKLYNTSVLEIQESMACSSKNVNCRENKVTDADVKALVERKQGKNSKKFVMLDEKDIEAELMSQLNEVEINTNRNESAERKFGATEAAGMFGHANVLQPVARQVEQPERKRSLLAKCELDFRRKIPALSAQPNEMPQSLPSSSSSYKSEAHELNRTAVKSSKENSGYQPVKSLGMVSSRKNAPFKSPLIENKAVKPEAMDVDDEMTNPLLKGVEPELLEAIKNTIVEKTKEVVWEDIAGLQEAKNIIDEAVVLPLLHPSLFQGLRSAPRGILLFGPPGKLFKSCVDNLLNISFQELEKR